LRPMALPRGALLLSSPQCDAGGGKSDVNALRVRMKLGQALRRTREERRAETASSAPTTADCPVDAIWSRSITDSASWPHVAALCTRYLCKQGEVGGSARERTFPASRPGSTYTCLNAPSLRNDACGYAACRNFHDLRMELASEPYLRAKRAGRES
jgi:hypothetical protein